MKKTTYIIALLTAFTLSTKAQEKPKQHVFYDTVKTVQTRVDYSPDTIPVYFKELIIGRHKIYHTETGYAIPNKDTVEIQDKWQKGFVIWQTYNKGGVTGTLSLSNGYSFSSTFTEPYYKTEYAPSPTMPGIFLYGDRKTHVTNKVIYSIKR